jgi:hypothetical protein
MNSRTTAVVLVVVIIVAAAAALLYFDAGASLGIGGHATKFEVSGLWLNQYATGNLYQQANNLGFNLKDLANSPIVAIGVEVNGLQATPVDVDIGMLDPLPPGQTQSFDFLTTNAQEGQTYSVSITVTFADNSYQTYTTTTQAATSGAEFEVNDLHLSQYISQDPDNLFFNLEDLDSNSIIAVGVAVNGVQATGPVNVVIDMLFPVAPGQSSGVLFVASNVQSGGSFSVTITVTFADNSYQTYTTTAQAAVYYSP